MRFHPRHLIVPLFLIVCGYLLYSIQGEVRETTLEAARTQQVVHARQAAQGIEGFFDHYTGLLEYLASLRPVVQMGAEGRTLLAEFQAHRDELTAITRVDADGRILYTFPENPEVLGADISGQAHVRALRATRLPVVSDVFQAVQGYRTVALHVPVWEGTVFRGSLAALIPFDVLARVFLKELRVGATGHAWLLSQGGVELYCGNPGHGGGNPPEAPGDPSYRQLVQRMVAGQRGTATGQGSTHLGPDPGQGHFLISYAPVRVVDTTWSIAVAVSEAEVLGAAHAFRDRWMAAVAVLGVGLLLYGIGAVRTRAALREAAERQRAGAALQASYDTLRTVLDGIGADVYVADLDTHEILFMNRRMKEAFGADLEGEICWREFRDAPGPCPDCTNDRLLDAAGEPVGVVSWEGQNPLTGRWYLNYDQAVRWVDGRMVRLQVATDISDRKAVEEGRLRADKLESLGVLAGGIAHDFNNLLLGIMGNLSLARLQVNDDTELAGLLGEAEQASARATALTRQLLTFSKGGAPVKQLGSVAEILRESCSFVLRGSKSRAEFHLAEDLWAADIDPGQIGQVVHNLVLNADHAMPDGGTIQVAARNVRLDGHSLALPRGDYVEVVIRDQGMGIAPEHLARIFDPYFTTKGQGSGLGLATCHSIVRRHGGHIGAVSVPGGGAIFTIHLPASPGAPQTPAEEPELVLPGKGRILVMDDEEMIRGLAESMLGAVGYAAQTAADGTEAVELYRRARVEGMPFDAVILDLTVPGGVGGEEALRRIHDFDPGVVAVVSSGYAADPILADFAARGFAGTLAKPYTVKDLQRVLGEALGG